MEGSNGNSSRWAMERRVEGLVNKHMADMALETLQQRLTAVSQEMNHLSAEISRREDSNRVEDLPRRTNPQFMVGSLPESCNQELVDEKKLMPNTSSSSAGRRLLRALSTTHTFNPLSFLESNMLLITTINMSSSLNIIEMLVKRWQVENLIITSFIVLLIRRIRIQIFTINKTELSEILSFKVK